MGKDPAFLLYSSDFLIGCSNLTMSERGQYITMLCLQHQKGHLTKKVIELSVGEASEDVLKNFETDNDGLYFNKKLEEVIIERENYAKSRYENGKKGGRPKKETIEKPQENHMVSKTKTIQKPYENHTEDENINENININNNLILNNIYNYWNSKNIIKHRELNKDISKSIENALKLYSEEEIKTYIDRYAQVIFDKEYFWGYRWTLKDFLSRRDAISSFTDEGAKWINYKEKFEKSKNESKESSYDANKAFEYAIKRAYDKNIKKI